MSKATWERYCQAENRKALRRAAIWIAVVAFAFAASVALAGCGHRYQPPGQDLWRAL